MLVAETPSIHSTTRKAPNFFGQPFCLRSKKTKERDLSFITMAGYCNKIDDAQATLTSSCVESGQLPKTLQVISPNGDQRTVSVVDTTTVREILQQCQEDGVQDRKPTLIRGVTLLEPDMTVGEAGLEDGDEISLIWSDLFLEMERWTGEKMDRSLYVRTPAEITRIDDEAFCNCRTLIKIVINHGVTSIGRRAFYGCSSLREVEIPNSVIGIGSMAFAYCRSLTRVKIPGSVTSVGISTFAHCRSLTQMKIPLSCTFLGPRAFADCSSLREVEVPKSLIFRETVFDECNSLKVVKRVES